jgi:hypothetical protein
MVFDAFYDYFSTVPLPYWDTGVQTNTRAYLFSATPVYVPDETGVNFACLCTGETSGYYEDLLVEFGETYESPTQDEYWASISGNYPSNILTTKDGKKFYKYEASVEKDISDHFPFSFDNKRLVWWNILEKYELSVVRAALDTWVDSETKPPSPAQIKEICKPKEQFHKALPRPTISEEQLKQNLEKISDMVKPKDKTDYKKWARDILENPKGLPDISVRFAKEALNIN